MKFLKWLAGAFEDQEGSASSKRFVLYGCMAYLWMIVKGSLEGKTVDQEVLFTIGLIILFCIGAITTEFASKMYARKTGEPK